MGAISLSLAADPSAGTDASAADGAVSAAGATSAPDVSADPAAAPLDFPTVPDVGAHAAVEASCIKCESRPWLKRYELPNLLKG